MIGVIAGDIIGSPYRNNNTADVKQHHFNLFASTDKVTLDEQRRRAYSRTYEAKPTVVTAGALAVADWILNGEHTKASLDGCLDAREVKQHPTGIEALAMLAPVGEYAVSADEAVNLGAVAMSALSDNADDLRAAQVFSHIGWMASHGVSMNEIRHTVKDVYDIETGMSAAELRPLLTGQYAMAENGTLTLGDGKTATDCMTVLPAVLTMFMNGESCEDSVRRAVALGGDSSTVAALVGALSEPFHKDLPQDVRKKAEGYLGMDDKNLISRFERLASHQEEEVRKTAAVSQTLLCISQKGKNPVYVIPEGREDMEAAVKSLCRRQKRGYTVIRPSEMEAVLAEMSEQKDVQGLPLNGVYVEHARPEVKCLWLQEGELRTSTNRAAVGEEKLSSVEKRKFIFNDFNGLKDYAENIRTELERKAGFEEDGKHVHFVTAFYPVVGDRHIELFEGDILRGRVGLDDCGRIRVDTNAKTGSLAGEYLEGVLNSMNIFHGRDNVMDLKLTLDEYCLDSGKIEDDEEREALGIDDDNAESVKHKYKSNIDRAIEDLASVRGELPEAVLHMTQKEIRHEAEKAAAGVEMRATKVSDEIFSRSHVGEVFTVGHSNMEAEDLLANLRKYGIELVVDVRSWPKSDYCPQFNIGTVDKALDAAGIEYASMGYDEQTERPFAFGARQYRPKDQVYGIYALENKDGKCVGHELFLGDEECVKYCKDHNKSLPKDSDRRIDTAERMGKSQAEAFLASGEATPEMRSRYEVYAGKYLSFEEIMKTQSFQDNMRNLREAVKNGVRVALLGSESNPADSHRFALLGRALEHPADKRYKPITVQHITRGGYLVSQAEIERDMMKSMGLSEEKNRLDEAFGRKGISILTRTRDNRGISLTLNKGSRDEKKKAAKQDETRSEKKSITRKMK